jgi:hypothetical protein
MEPVSPQDESMVRSRLVPALLASFVARARAGGPGRVTRFLRETQFGLREARLLAGAYPDLMEKLASEIAGDATRDPMERFCMLYELGYLAQAGRAGAVETLVRVANAGDPVTASRAILTLYPADLQGAQRALYMRRAGEGDEIAFDALSFFPDSATQAYIRSLLEKPQDGTPESFVIHLAAQELTGKYQLLTSPDWQIKLGETILKSENSKDVLWALSAARYKNFPNLTELLRQSLDQSMKQIEDQYARIPPGPPTAGGQPPTFEQMYTSESKIPVSRIGGHYDDLLVAQLELGGRLTEIERARLRSFGYGCDPKARLQELIDQEQSPH